MRTVRERKQTNKRSPTLPGRLLFTSREPLVRGCLTREYLRTSSRVLPLFFLFFFLPFLFSFNTKHYITHVQAYENFFLSREHGRPLLATDCFRLLFLHIPPLQKCLCVDNEQAKSSEILGRVLNLPIPTFVTSPLLLSLLLLILLLFIFC
ncbi:unnamed protein product [Xylocopa violacea]|uniref:Transmembrane protein n=1 Tax=Xylocopa violacea TaxID=135666 RepID=A0ABP1NXX3_XYLVO